MRRLRRIKILATLGPASSDSAMIRKLFEAGADVFRINMSHTQHPLLKQLHAAIRGVEAHVVAGALDPVDLLEAEQDDPPVSCTLTDLSLGGCYLKSISPFPQGTRVVLSTKSAELELRASGIVRIAHPEFGMGVEFIQSTTQQHDQVHRLIETLRASGEKSPELLVEPEGLESATSGDGAANSSSVTDDALLDLFRQKAQIPLDAFLEQMREQRQILETH